MSDRTDRNVFKIEFEPWEPEPALPPEGEMWVWKSDLGGLAIMTVANRKAQPCGWSPLHPYIDPNDPPRLDTVPEGEGVIGMHCGTIRRYQHECGSTFEIRRSGEAWRKVGISPSTIHVLARPNARDSLKREWPKRLRNLPDGVYGSIHGLPADNKGLMPPNNVQTRYEMVGNAWTLDTDDNGKPIIFGRLVEERKDADA